MHPRLRLTLMTAATLALVAIAAVALTTDPNPAREPASGAFAGGLRPSGPPVEFALRDEEGRTARARDARGRPAIVTFLYTSCRNECPTIAAQVRIALDRLGSPVPAYAISVDPANDTEAARRRFLTRHHLTSRMRFLSGPAGDLQRVWRAFGIQPQSDAREHSAYVVLLDAQGRQRVGFPVGALTPEGVVHDVRALAAER